MPSTRLRILYASVSGTARRVAETVQLDASDLEVELTDMHDVPSGSELDKPGEPVLFCIATTGAGNLPDDALALYEDLVKVPRYLGGLRYGLIALGDSSYSSTFCGGGELFDAVLQDLGAQRIGDIFRLDAMESTEPEVDALQWFATWKPAL